MGTAQILVRLRRLLRRFNAWKNRPYTEASGWWFREPAYTARVGRATQSMFNALPKWLRSPEFRQ